MLRNYGFSQENLIKRAENLLQVCQRDFNTLKKDGLFETELLEKLNKELSFFKSIVSDSFQLKQINLLNTQCKEKKKQIIKLIRIIQLRLETTCDKDNYYLKMLKTLKVHNISGDCFIENIRKIQALSPNFYSLGIPASITGNLNSFIVEYKKKFSKYNSMISNRKQISNERIISANRLSVLMSEICKIGKLVFKATNKEKYKDYVMYGK